MYIKFLVPQIHVEIVLNVVMAWNLAQIKLLSCRSRIDLRALKKSAPLYGNMAASNKSVVH